MIDHFGINCADLDVSKTFYDKVLGVLGHARVKDFDLGDGLGATGYGTGKPDFWISKFTHDLGPNREMHLAFTAPDRETVHAFVEAAVGLGAELLHEPRYFPEYHAQYYGGFVRDPDGNNVEAVCHRIAPEA